MEKIKDFNWGWMEGPSPDALFHKEHLTQEIFVDKIYESIFEVEEGDVVLDLGASIGPFSYSILEKNPSRVICVEPSPVEIPTLVSNLRKSNFDLVPYGISSQDGESTLPFLFGVDADPHLLERKVKLISFKTLLEKYNLEKIDFLKTDCEGGEYDVFNYENALWIKDNVKKVVGEWHLSSPELKEKFRDFRNKYLGIIFENFEIRSLNGVDIKWDLWNESFIEYYSEVIIHIDNR